MIMMQKKIIALPKLNNLTPTMESTALKLMEEAGELAQAIGKLRGMSGERCAVGESEALARITRELLDVAQTAVSMMFVLEERYGINIDRALDEHVNKLVEKGYLVPER
ncbi:MazG nucleotide pyrophosphohydrolase domain-containing protein [Desulfoscipio geothermicus DSM 3669]|uniref:MazG nucleotide pyrophosphohydrolase domain-containing protein n=2 Tax=Desulfoscipio geothermicus TaxID=39060 RepID=A0A1I6CYC6_9FIRM|nr:MazG nucleotide pyrophosphohydrolase domain-containing protein [Desulfoscipio geothermicus DSM 3669]